MSSLSRVNPDGVNMTPPSWRGCYGPKRSGWLYWVEERITSGSLFHRHTAEAPSGREQPVT
ncbi:hypothetical protein [Micromonospora sp. NPDC050200]|uniref:hypothetical protein n=1 Tax=Micromonospora sp. NPDC050200 TaxID=3155664 RepID=UPI0033D1271E